MKTREKRKGTPIKCRVSENSKERQDNKQCKETEGKKSERVRLDISSIKLKISKERFIQKWAQKGQKC